MGAQNWNLELAASDNNEKQLNSFHGTERGDFITELSDRNTPVEYIDEK